MFHFNRCALESFLSFTLFVVNDRKIGVACFCILGQIDKIVSFIIRSCFSGSVFNRTALTFIRRNEIDPGRKPLSFVRVYSDTFQNAVGYTVQGHSTHCHAHNHSNSHDYGQ